MMLQDSGIQKGINVFISWAGADREVKNAIATRLDGESVNGEPIRCWESDENCSSDFSEECIRNIRRSAVVIVIVSEASMDPRSYVFNEVVEARTQEGLGNLNIIVYKLTDAPYTDRFAMQLNHISDANHVSRIQKMGNMGGIETLVKRVKHLIGCRVEGEPEKPYDVNFPMVEGASVFSGGYFVDNSRNSVIAEIESAFSRSNIVILSELFGFGKKSVIKKYVQTHGYKSAVEIYGRHETLRGFFLNSLKFSNVNDGVFVGDENSIIRKKIELLKKLKGDSILIFSDVDVEDEADDFIIGLLGQLNCHVAIVTQNSACSYDDYFPVVVVGRMETEYLLELFFHYYDRESYMDREPLKPLLLSFFDDVGGHTKTVEIAASVLSKEMRADPDELAGYLAPHAGDKSALSDRIVEKLSSLIVYESFDDNEKKTLLLIALMADPVIEISELYALMKQCNITDRRVITALDAHRWITYDGRNRTVYIEPIIAKICVNKLLSDYSAPKKCFSYLWHQYDAMLSRSHGSLCAFYARIARFFELLEIPAISELFSGMLTSATNGQIDAAMMESNNDRFTDWFHKIYAKRDEIETERDTFMFLSAIAIQSTFLLPSKLMSQIPVFFSVQNGDTAIREGLLEMLNSILCADEEDYSAAAEYFAIGLSASDPENAGKCGVKDIISSLSSDVMLDLSDKNFSAVQTHLDKIIEILESSPEICGDTECSDALMVVIKSYLLFCLSSGAYRPGIALCENLISIPWQSIHLHQILLIYARLLLSSSANDEAVGAMGAAEELLDEVLSSLPQTDILPLKREHVLIYMMALTEIGEVDAACEKNRELLSLGTENFEIDVLSALDALINALMIRSQKTELRRTIEDSREFLVGILNSELSTEAKETAETLIALESMYGNNETEEFSVGGIITDKSYYQRYSSEKKNNFIAMMSYNRIADGVRRFDFSSYSSEEIASHTEKLRARALAGEDKKKLMPEAFALVSEAGMRTLGYKHHSSQYVGAAVMLDGKIAEILNGEGKTYTIALVAYVNSLYSERTFVVDRSCFLTERNYKWMRGLLRLLGVKVCHWEKGCRINNLDGNEQIIYTDYATLGFDILNRELSVKTEDRWDFSKHSIIVDEADVVLVEEAKIPIVINGRPGYSLEKLEKCKKAYELAEQIKTTDANYCRNINWNDVDRIPAIDRLIEDKFGIRTEEIISAGDVYNIKTLIYHAINCLNSVPGKDFFVKNGMIEEENTSTGLFYEVSAERGYFYSRHCGLDCTRYEKMLSMTVTPINMTYVYGMLRRFGSVSGTSATASSFKKEFKEIYGLETVSIPPALPVKRSDKTVSLYAAREYKDRDIVKMIVEKHATGQPVLLIVKSVGESKKYSKMLDAVNVPHKVLNAETSEQSPDILSEAGVFGSVLIATQLANRGVDIKLGGDAERMTLRMLADIGCDLSRLDDILYSVPNEEVRSGELYIRYAAAFEKNRAAVQVNRERVVEAGGLCVICADTYEDLRVEQQIRGRAGRQGAVGESYVFESIDDEAIKILYGKKYDALVYSFASNKLELLDSKLVRSTLEWARAKLHHVMFKDMQNAAELTARLEKSKRLFLELLYAINEYGTAKAEAVDKLLALWANDEDVLDWAEFVIERVSARGEAQDEMTCVEEIIESNAETLDEYRKSGKPYMGIEAVLMLARYEPEMFSIKSAESVSDRLIAIAKNRINSGLYSMESLYNRLSKALGEHIEAMRDIERAYCNSRIKNIDRTLREAYDIDRKKRITEEIGWWLSAKEQKSVSMSRANLRKSPRMIGRHDPCPCGSGKKYKNCCGADEENTDN